MKYESKTIVNRKYTNETLNDIYPKTLLIRNTVGGAIWQLYHVQKESEAQKLSINAEKNGFWGRTLVDYRETEEETYSNWRTTKGGKKIIEENVLKNENELSIEDGVATPET